MTIVVDASIAAAWLLPDGGDRATLDVLGRLEASRGIAPSIFLHEIRNILLLCGRRKRISGAVTATLLPELVELQVEDMGPGGDATVMDLARFHHLTAYDAADVALALPRGEPLATRDEAMAAAARARGVTLFGPLAP